MKKYLLLALVVCAFIKINAVVNNSNRGSEMSEIDAIIADSKLKFEQGSNDVFMPDNKTEWRNGVYECYVNNYYDKNDKAVGRSFCLNYNDEKLAKKHYYEIKIIKGKPTCVNHPGVTAEHLVAGRWDMIVFRNSNGAVLDVILSKKGKYHEESVDDMRDMINGVYAGTGKNVRDTVVMGAVYGEDNYRLPGADYLMEYMDYNGDMPKLLDYLLVAYTPERMKRVHMPEPSMKVDDKGVTHYYADSKEVSREEYEHLRSKPCGYGGHGSLHGPLLWKVKPQGINLAVELNGPFVEELDAFYSNFRDEKFTLKWVRSPYKDMKQRWSVLSVRPVTRGMLAMYDRSTLQDMLFYLKNRKNATDIEKLNKSLINSIVGNAAIHVTPRKSKK